MQKNLNETDQRTSVYKLKSTNSLKSFSVRFDENLNTLINIIGKNTERRFPPHCVRDNGTIEKFLVPTRVLQGLDLRVNVFFYIIKDLTIHYFV